MIKFILVIFSFFYMSAVAAVDLASIELERPAIDLHDSAAIKRGAKFFAANCMACHTLVYLRYNKLAQQAGITYEKMPVNVKSWPQGVTPPDLSLEADVRGVDWIYTYLHSFYLDKMRPMGVNNLVLPNTAMPDIVMPYQGQQILAHDVKKTKKIVDTDYEWYDLVELQSPGAMTSQQFDATITDVVTFLAYAAEPYSLQQTRLGYWVIGFLLVLFVLLYYLKKQYWKDIK